MMKIMKYYIYIQSASVIQEREDNEDSEAMIANLQELRPILADIDDNLQDQYQENDNINGNQEEEIHEETTTHKFLINELARLLDRITSKVKANDKIWGIYGLFNETLEKIDNAKDCYMKQCRELKVSKWNKDQNQFTDLCIAFKKLIEIHVNYPNNDELYKIFLIIIDHH